MCALISYQMRSALMYACVSGSIHVNMCVYAPFGCVVMWVANVFVKSDFALMKWQLEWQKIPLTNI